MAKWLQELIAKLSYPKLFWSYLAVRQQYCLYRPDERPKTPHLNQTYYIRQSVEESVVDLTYIPTEDMLADSLRKPLAKYLFERLDPAKIETV